MSSRMSASPTTSAAKGSSDEAEPVGHVDLNRCRTGDRNLRRGGRRRAGASLRMASTRSRVPYRADRCSGSPRRPRRRCHGRTAVWSYRGDVGELLDGGGDLVRGAATVGGRVGLDEQRQRPLSRGNRTRWRRCLGCCCVVTVVRGAVVGQRELETDCRDREHEQGNDVVATVSSGGGDEPAHRSPITAASGCSRRGLREFGFGVRRRPANPRTAAAG